MKDTRGGSPGVVEAVTSSDVKRLDEGIETSRGGVVAFLSESNVGCDHEQSTRCSSGGGPLGVARGGNCVEVTADGGRMGAERRPIRSGCIPTGGWDWIKEALSGRDIWIGVLCLNLGDGAWGLLIVGLSAFISSWATRDGCIPWKD